MLYKARNEAIKIYDDYSSMISETKAKANKGTGLKHEHLNKYFKECQ